MPKIHKTCVGGQALIEGIMMRGPKGSAMSVRLPDGTIDTEMKDVTLLRDKNKFFGIPIIRGVVSFIDSLVFGYKCLMESAEKSGMDDIKEEDMSKLDKWIDKHFGDKMMAVIGVISTILGFAIAMFLFAYLPTLIVDLIDKNGAVSRLHPLFEGILKIIIFVAYCAGVSQMKDIKRVFKYHGAEHKTIFCYENGLDLTVENVRKQRRFHPRCGTSFIFVMLILSILTSTVVILIFPGLGDIRWLWMIVKLLILPIVVGIGYEFIRYAGKHDNLFTKILSAPGLWMQRITTKEPTDDMIEVGIAAFNAVITDNPEDDEIK